MVFSATQTLRMADATWRRVGDLEQKLALSNTRSSGRKKKELQINRSRRTPHRAAPALTEEQTSLIKCCLAGTSAV